MHQKVAATREIIQRVNTCGVLTNITALLTGTRLVELSSQSLEKGTAPKKNVSVNAFLFFLVAADGCTDVPYT